MNAARPPRDRDPRPLADALAELGRDLGLPPPDALGEVLAAWPDAIGAQLAAHVRVRSLRDGLLTVEVDAPAFATEVRYRDQELVARLAERLGRTVVERLRVVVGGGATRP